MTLQSPRHEGRLGPMVVVSLLVHLTMFVILTKANFFPGLKYREAPVYYVDVVNLPVANPRAGSPAAAPGPSTPAPLPRTAPREMTLPAKAKPTAQTKVSPQKAAPESAREFEKRLKQLERESEARHEAAALDALKNRVAGGGRTPAGMPGATGTEAGSDYGSYIQSRLKDAFRTTIASQSKNPEVVVRLTIDRRGRVVRTRLERSSGDKLFEDSVMRAIAKAEQTFPPPPNGREFEQGFSFKPEGVGKK